MNILLISECNKRALTETRRILDQFAERKGRRTWQTPITDEGLKTLRRLLMKTARRNTAVACYWIRAKNQTELLWIVGNRLRFNEQGTVPTDITERDILRCADENQSHSNHASALMAGLAGLFHDFGKANELFQEKLNPKKRKKGKGYEPYRHEWLSALLFLTFVDKRPDKEWLAHLTRLTEGDGQKLLKRFELPEKPSQSSLSLQGITGYSPLAACITWLIVSHHRLPLDMRDFHRRDSSPLEGHRLPWDRSRSNIETAFGKFDLNWNACNHKLEFSAEEQKQVRNFSRYGTPLASERWREKAQWFAQRALKQDKRLAEMARPECAFPLQMARMTLMLADHSYSAKETCTAKWQDPSYEAFANTKPSTQAGEQKREPKQKLDEHCIGVARNAYRLTRVLPNLRSSLPAVSKCRALKRRTTEPFFAWQNHAYELACSIREKTCTQGFFGVDMASTGRGKTLANARIMYGLSNPQLGCRFSVALGLRTLTLQTGKALRQRLKLNDEAIAVHIGSQAVQDLYESKASSENDTKKLSSDDAESSSGSESEKTFSAPDHVSYKAESDQTVLDPWLAHQSKVHDLVSAPIYVSTIDHLIPACEGTQGGKQIAPMLRLLSSDLILDEPDDFSNEDIPALTRLVYQAGLLGSRVLLSAATLPPALISYLFDAYLHGRRQFNRVHNAQRELPVVCAWFDEFGCKCAPDIGCRDRFLKAHEAFTAKRLKKLQREPALRQGAFLELADKKDMIPTLAQAILHHAQELAKRHHTQAGGKTFSAGIVRMANIEPMVAVAKELLKCEPAEDTHMHYCIYHSQHPLSVRSAIEDDLDSLLKRDPKNPITAHPKVQKAFADHPAERHHVFVVLATPVAEVGRDHDYDWAIVEPSSMRSIIQLAGRVQRHRKQVPESVNIRVLTQNIRALKGAEIAYCKPGYESKEKVRRNAEGQNSEGRWLKLPDHDLKTIWGDKNKKHLATITSEPRFISPQREALLDREKKCPKGFIELEHLALRFLLRDKAEIWWTQAHAHLFGEIQRLTPFRHQNPKQSYRLYLEEGGYEPKLEEWDPFTEKFVNSGKLELQEVENYADRVSVWTDTDLSEVMEGLRRCRFKEKFEREEIYRRFAGIELYDIGYGNKYRYHPVLGVFRGKI